jgi:hypothetical protein
MLTHVVEHMATKEDIARIDTRIGDLREEMMEQFDVAPQWREQRLPADRRLHQSDLEAGGGAGREAGGRNRVPPPRITAPSKTAHTPANAV